MNNFSNVSIATVAAYENLNIAFYTQYNVEVLITNENSTRVVCLYRAKSASLSSGHWESAEFNIIKPLDYYKVCAPTKNLENRVYVFQQHGLRLSNVMSQTPVNNYTNLLCEYEFL